jgi:hypothetical protein
MPVPDDMDNMKLCICGTCPTFKQSPLTGGFFCAKGKAKEKVNNKGCVCGSCPVFRKFELKDGVFCITGKSP